MFNIPVIDFNAFAVNMLPPNHRTARFILWMMVLIYPMAWLWNVFAAYMNGSADAYYDPSTTYPQGQWVKTLQGVYVSMQDGNTGNDVTDTAWWYKLMPSFIGVVERAKYSSRYLTLTYALNRQFGTTFQQPPYPDDPYVAGAAFSQIYVTKQVPSFVSWLLGTTPNAAGNVGTIPSTVVLGTTPVIGTASSYQYLIHIPVAVFNALGATDAIRTAKVNRVVNTTNPAGIGYSIVTY